MLLLLINVAIGVISRSAPTLNLFSFGFPITLIAVFILLYVSVGSLATSSDDLIESGLLYMQTLIGDLANG
jgi:flagellar biosynthetic protein FliR